MSRRITFASDPDGKPVLPMFDAPAPVAWNPPSDALRIALRAASPLRGRAEQDDVDGLALFDQHRSPGLL